MYENTINKIMDAAYEALRIGKLDNVTQLISDAKIWKN